MNQSPTAGRSNINVQDFVHKASEKGVAEIEAARSALDKAEIEEVRSLAERMIQDHEAANQKLKSIATQKGLDLEDDASLMDKAKKAMLQLRTGESFDHAYLRNQINEHEKSISLFEDATGVSDPEINAFAQQTLPTLKEHLSHARRIYAEVA